MQVEACERMLGVLDLGPEFDGLRVAALGLAAAVDLKPERAALWAEYRAVLVLLLDAAPKGEGDPFDEFVRGLQSEVGDSA